MLPTLETDRPRQSRLAPFIAYVIAFHLAWAAWPYFIYRKLVAVGERTLTYALLNLSIRLLVWVAPVMLYLRFVDGVAPLADLELDRRVGRGLVVALALTAVNFVGSVVRFGLPHPTLQAVTWNSVLTSLLFLGVHLPGWSALHMLTVDRQVFVFVFGVVMAIVVRYSGSLWAAIVTHSTNDFMSFVLFHR